MKIEQIKISGPRGTATILRSGDEIQINVHTPGYGSHGGWDSWVASARSTSRADRKFAAARLRERLEGIKAGSIEAPEYKRVLETFAG